MTAANDRDTLRIDPSRTMPPSTMAPGSDLEARAMAAVQSGVAQGIAALGGLLTKPAETTAAAAPRPDNRALAIATAALVLVGSLWLWSGRVHTDRMDRLEERLDSTEVGLGALSTKISAIDASLGALATKISAIEKGQIELTYATIAIADKVGAPIMLTSE